MSDVRKGCLAVKDYNTAEAFCALRLSMVVSRVKEQDVARSGPALTLPNMCTALAGG